MKTLLSLLLISSTLFACQGSNQVGECVGFTKQRAGIKYELDTRNLVVTAVFSGGVIIPVVWALEYVYCPVAP